MTKKDILAQETLNSVKAQIFQKIKTRQRIRSFWLFSFYIKKCHFVHLK